MEQDGFKEPLRRNDMYPTKRKKEAGESVDILKRLFPVVGTKDIHYAEIMHRFRIERHSCLGKTVEAWMKPL